jgi:Peptidase inhibitor I78 family
MRKPALAAPALLVACAAQPSVHGETPRHICKADGGQQFIGQFATSESGAAILRATHSAILRWAPPGVMLTMDFSSSRVTVRLGPDEKITAINCG